MSGQFVKLNVNDESLAANFLDLRELGHHVEISQSDYFKYTAAKNITAASFKILSRFFSGVDTEGNKIDFSAYKKKEIGYEEMVKLIYKYPLNPLLVKNMKTGYDFTAIANQKEYRDYYEKKSLHDKALKGELALSHYNTNTNDDRYAANALIFGSASIAIEKDNVKFYIDENGRPSEVRNFSFKAKDDNYDYESKKIPPIFNSVVKYVLRDNSDKTTKIHIAEDRGNSRFTTINRAEFDSLKRNTPQINNESMNFGKFTTEADKIINTRFNLREHYIPSPILGVPPEIEIEYIRKPNLFNAFHAYNYNKNLLDDFYKASALLDKTIENLNNSKNIINRLSLTYREDIESEKRNNNFDHFLLTKNHRLGFNKDALNKSTKTSDLASTAIVTDDNRVANHNPIRTKAMEINGYEGRGFSPFHHSTRLPNAQGRPYKIANDPLILDLNGDGVRAVSYNEKPVLFDIDNDGGSLEETGWLSHQDGLLVRDLNNNGKIDNMSEVFSEYYAGSAGRNGEAGEKRFANGFEALKSLDTNKDNVFDSKDRDFNAVRVWQDANHNGVTDAGELKTLSSLKITAIDLAYQEAGGQLFFGNELLAKGYFAYNCKKHAKINRL